jgi:hypothetical protein
MTGISVRELAAADRPWAARFLRAEAGDTRIVSRGAVHDADTLPGFVGSLAGAPVGLLTWHIAASELEVITPHDNLPAIDFHRRRAMTLVAVHPGAIAESRKLKPGIPLRGVGGRSITAEVECEYRL